MRNNVTIVSHFLLFHLKQLPALQESNKTKASRSETACAVPGWDIFYSSIIILMISLSVSFMPMRPRRLILRMVFSTPFLTSPSPP